MKLFQVAMILRPTDKDAENGKGPELIMEPSWFLAPTDQGAAMLAGRKLADDKLAYMDRIEVLVRPF